MSQLIVLGIQWGDEGKGKIIDFLTEFTNFVVRFQGGGNAGHTLIVDGKKTVLHLMPSGILHNKVVSVIANGVVTDLTLLSKEINNLSQNNIKVTKDNFQISYNTHLILPYHKLIDKYREERRTNKIGTTQKGIGPAYEDKVARRGIRFQDFLNKERFDKLLKINIDYYNFQFEHYFGKDKINYNDIVAESDFLREFFTEFGKDTTLTLHNATLEGENILLEGAQGTLLDIDHGTYPFVTSSNTTSGGGIIGTGHANCPQTSVLGVFKAYTTRVGEGPFPTELHDEIGKFIAKNGHEVGATTGRARRVGWLDLVALKYAIRINGLTSLAITKLDVLSGLDKIKVAIAYKYEGKILDSFTNNIEILNKIEPVYQSYDTWDNSLPLESIRVYEDLPQNAKKFIKALESLLEIPIEIVSVGPDRSETIVINNPFR